MGRPYHPERGVNRQILLLLRRQPGAWPGTVARLLGIDTAGVRAQLARLEANGHVRSEYRDDHRWLYATDAGLQVLRRRRPLRGTDPYRAPESDTERTRAVHS
jgi:predicted ArsR family transcriptional regulator